MACCNGCQTVSTRRRQFESWKTLSGSSESIGGLVWAMSRCRRSLREEAVAAVCPMSVNSFEQLMKQIKNWQCTICQWHPTSISTQRGKVVLALMIECSTRAKTSSRNTPWRGHMHSIHHPRSNAKNRQLVIRTYHHIGHGRDQTRPAQHHSLDRLSGRIRVGNRAGLPTATAIAHAADCHKKALRAVA